MKRSMLVWLLLVAIGLAILAIPSAAQDKGAKVTAKAPIDTVKGFIHFTGGVDLCLCNISGYMTQSPSTGSPLVANLSGLNISVYVTYRNKLVRVIGQWVDCVECTKIDVMEIEESYIPGDANCDGIFDISDCVYLLQYIFLGGPAPVVLAAGDVDCNGGIDIGDVVAMIGRIFLFTQWPDCP